MIIWVLLFLDLLALISLSLAHFEVIFSLYLLLISATYLGIKGMIFFGEPMSIVDFGVAFYIILVMIFQIQTFIYYIILGWFIFKIFTTLPSLLNN